MKQIEQIKKLKDLEQSSQFEGERITAHNKAEKLYQEVMDMDNSKLSMSDYLDKFELFAKHESSDGKAIKEAQEHYRVRQKRKKIIEEMLDMWEKLGGEI